jgi:hypothetical protein
LHTVGILVKKFNYSKTPEYTAPDCTDLDLTLF